MDAHIAARTVSTPDHIERATSTATTVSTRPAHAARRETHEADEQCERGLQPHHQSTRSRPCAMLAQTKLMTFDIAGAPLTRRRPDSASSGETTPTKCRFTSTRGRRALDQAEREPEQRPWHDLATVHRFGDRAGPDRCVQVPVSTMRRSRR